MTDAEFDTLWEKACTQWPKQAEKRSQIVEVAEKFRYIELHHAMKALSDAIFAAGNSWLPTWPDILHQARELQRQARRDENKLPDGEWDEYAVLPPAMRHLAELKRESPGKSILLGCRASGESFAVECSRNRQDGYAVQIQLRGINSWQTRIISHDGQLDAYDAPVVSRGIGTTQTPPGRKEGPLPPNGGAVERGDGNADRP